MFKTSKSPFLGNVTPGHQNHKKMDFEVENLKLSLTLHFFITLT